MPKFQEHQWVSFKNGYGRVYAYIGSGIYELQIPTKTQTDFIRKCESELTAVDEPKFNVGDVLLYTGFDLVDLKKGSLVTITNEDEFSIYKYEVRFEGDRDLVSHLNYKKSIIEVSHAKISKRSSCIIYRPKF